MDDDVTDDLSPAPDELTRLADGTLAPERAAELRAEVAASPHLAAELAEQERAVAMMRSLDVPAPASLRARVEKPGRAARAHAARANRRRSWLRPALPTAVVLAAATLVAVFGPSNTGAPATIPQAARLALAASTQPAPGADPSAPGLLRISNAGITFPNWAVRAGGTAYRATGARTDALGGRRVVTVFYASLAGTRIGYAIVSGAPLRPIAAATTRTVKRYGVWFTLQRIGSEGIVTWERNGHTCVIAGRSVSEAALLALAGSDKRARGDSTRAAAFATQYA